jgi:hypothetical protein
MCRAGPHEFTAWGAALRASPESACPNGVWAREGSYPKQNMAQSKGAMSKPPPIPHFVRRPFLRLPRIRDVFIDALLTIYAFPPLLESYCVGRPLGLNEGSRMLLRLLMGLGLPGTLLWCYTYVANEPAKVRRILIAFSILSVPVLIALFRPTIR